MLLTASVLSEWFWITTMLLDMDWGQSGEELDEHAKVASGGSEENCGRPIPSRLTPNFPFCDTNYSLWVDLPLLFRLVDLPAQSINAHPLIPRVEWLPPKWSWCPPLTLDKAPSPYTHPTVDSCSRATITHPSTIFQELASPPLVPALFWEHPLGGAGAAVGGAKGGHI